MKLVGCSIAITIAWITAAQATQVYNGCATPPSTYRHVWFVDPVNGKTPAAGGDGSQSKPWNSIQGIMSGHWSANIVIPGYTRPLLSTVPYNHKGLGGSAFADTAGNPPINPGDMIMLMGGNYGDLNIGDFNLPTANSDWITVQAVLGQTPVFSSLTFSRTNKWLWSGIKVQSLRGTNGQTGPLVAIGDQGPTYTTSDIVLTDFDVSSADHANTTSWSQANWSANARIGFSAVGSAGNGSNGVPYSTCISFTNSHVHDVYQGVLAMTNNTLISGNEIDHFAADGLDYAANNLAITHNYEHDNFTIDANHEDAMQGQNGPLAAGVSYNAFSNILIDSNVIIRQTDSSLKFATYLQGIDTFDEDWSNVTVTNNVIVTSSCWGIYYESAHNVLIANNTVLFDNQIPQPNCSPLIAIGGKTHEGPSSSNYRVTNNIGYAFAIGAAGDTGAVFDHNVALAAGGFSYYDFTKSQNVFFTPAGTDVNGNVTPATTIMPATQFVTWSPSTMSYNLLLKAGAKAIGAGSAAGAQIDILGYARRAPYTAGAYSYPR
jgi:parallel beta-helix repeat protein